MQVIINAGGTGTRLWPVSNQKSPKQFTNLIGGSSSAKKTFVRLKEGLDLDKIWINTNIKFQETVIQQLAISPSKILTEPEKRDNFAAIVSHSALVARQTSRDEPLIFVQGDHEIPETENQKYIQGLVKAAKAVESKKYSIVVCGIKPAFANNMVGYIKFSPQDKDRVYQEVVDLSSFTEKPDLKTAEEFVQAGNYLWNLGYFGFTFNKIMEIVDQLYPDLTGVFEKIYELGEITPDLYTQIPKTSIDYAIIEKTKNMGVVGMDIKWEDIGSWRIMQKYLPDIQSNPNWVEIESEGNKIWTQNPDKPVALIGIKNKVIVDSPNGLLILDPSLSAEVKKVAKLFDK